MKKISQWLKGQVLLEIKGWGTDRLINLCKKNNIVLYDLKSIEDGYSFKLSSKNHKKILTYNEKIRADIKIIDKLGLPNFFYKYRKRKIFILCFLLFILGIYIFSNYIWNISIIGNETYTREELIKDINNNFISLGTSKKHINCNELEKKLRDKYSDIAWISCEVKGTNLIINIEETVPTKEILTSSTPCNIIAYKDAIITDIIINSGQRVVNLGDEVKKNDILLTGVINVYNEFDELIETNYTAAKGEIWGIVEYEYNDKFNLNTIEKVYTGNTKNKYSINIFNTNIKLPYSKIKFKDYDTITTSNKFEVLKNLYLPIGINKNSYKEYTIKNITMTQEEASKTAEARLFTYIDKLKKKGVSILENNVTINIEGDVCTASGTIKCKEVIGVPCDIEIIHEGEQE